MSLRMNMTVDYNTVIIYVILVMESVFFIVQGKVRHINMCETNVMIRKDILLYHDINNLDLQRDDVICQCDLYTPPFKGCVSMKALNMDTITQLERCDVLKGQNFSIQNTSCVIQYRVNEMYDNCTHNITVMIVAEKVLREPVKPWLYIAASDRSGVYVNCKWTGSLTSVTYDMETTEVTTTSATTTQVTGYSTDGDLTNFTCTNCTTPSGQYNREIKPSEVADQIEILIATASGFIIAFLVISFICLCRSSRSRGKLEVTPVKPKEKPKENPKETVAQLSVTTETPAPSSVYDTVFVDTCSAEIKRDGSGSYSEPASNDIDEDNKYAHIVRRSSDDCYDNVAFQS